MTRSLRGLFFNRVFQCVIHHLSNPKMKMLKKRMLRTSLNRQLSMLPVAVDAFEPAFRGLRGHSGHGATFRGHGATVQIKQVGLTRSLRIPYAFLTRKNTFFFQNWFRGSNEHFSTRTNWNRGTGKTGFYRNRTV